MRRYHYVPILKRLHLAHNVLIERVLPREGVIGVNVGDVVTPSDQIGSCRLSYNIVELGANFKPANKKLTDTLIPQGVGVGRVDKTLFKAPFKGRLVRNNGGFEFHSEESDYWLLPGVWGEVSDVKEKRAVLIKTQSVNVQFLATTGFTKSGELIVFPNPSELMGTQYFDNYLKTSKGKIVYVGHSASLAMLLKAHELGVEGIMAGSATREVFNFAHKNNIALGVFGGYGGVATPDEIFSFLNDVSNRYVFLNGTKGVLQVPVQSDYSQKSTKNIFKAVMKGLRVQVFSLEYYGKTGVVDSTTNSSIFVKLEESGESVEVSPPNIFALV